MPENNQMFGKLSGDIPDFFPVALEHLNNKQVSFSSVLPPNYSLRPFV